MSLTSEVPDHIVNDILFSMFTSFCEQKDMSEEEVSALMSENKKDSSSRREHLISCMESLGFNAEELTKESKVVETMYQEVENE